MTTYRISYSWGRCDCCGGALPLIDGDNDHPSLPHCPSGGECPGSQTSDGICGAWRGARLVRFSRLAQQTADAAETERGGQWELSEREVRQ